VHLYPDVVPHQRSIYGAYCSNTRACPTWRHALPRFLPQTLPGALLGLYFNATDVNAFHPVLSLPARRCALYALRSPTVAGRTWTCGDDDHVSFVVAFLPLLPRFTRFGSLVPFMVLVCCCAGRLLFCCCDYIPPALRCVDVPHTTFVAYSRIVVNGYFVIVLRVVVHHAAPRCCDSGVVICCAVPRARTRPLHALVVARSSAL